jgi:microcompartment protein CcmL/EutN
MEELKAIAMIELNSIAKGVAAGDEMLKAADVELVFAQPICAGKYMVMVSGDVDSIERANEVGKAVAGEFLVDDFVQLGLDGSLHWELSKHSRWPLRLWPQMPALRQRMSKLLKFAAPPVSVESHFYI